MRYLALAVLLLSLAVGCRCHRPCKPCPCKPCKPCPVCPCEAPEKAD